MLHRLSNACPQRSTGTGRIAIIVDDVVWPHEGPREWPHEGPRARPGLARDEANVEEPRARPELDRDETNVAKPRARPKLDRSERWWLLFNRLEKVAKRKRLGNALFNTLNHTHSDFLANFPMTGQMLPDLRRNRGSA